MEHVCMKLLSDKRCIDHVPPSLPCTLQGPGAPLQDAHCKSMPCTTRPSVQAVCCTVRGKPTLWTCHALSRLQNTRAGLSARLHEAVAMHHKVLGGDDGEQRAHHRQLHGIAARLTAAARQHHDLRARPSQVSSLAVAFDCVTICMCMRNSMMHAASLTHLPATRALPYMQASLSL